MAVNTRTKAVNGNITAAEAESIMRTSALLLTEILAFTENRPSLLTTSQVMLS